MLKKCRTCHREFEPEQLADRRCAGCQVDFESWLRGDSPTTYQPRRDGVWRDVARPTR